MRLRAPLVVLLLASLFVSLPAPPARAASDTTPPTLQSVSLVSPGPFTSGDAVTVQWQATDDVAVSHMQVRLHDAAGKEHTAYANAPATQGSVTVDSSWANGQVTASHVWVVDVNGNSAWYFRDGTLGVSGSGYSSRHDVSIAAADFVTQGIASDLTPPTVEGLSLVSPGPFTRGDTVEFAVDARDDVAASRVTVNVLDGAGKSHNIGGYPQPSSVSGVIDDTWGDGPVSLRYVLVEDSSFNHALYWADGQVTYSKGVTGPSTHALDLSAAGFSTYDVGGDVTPPVLSSVTLETPGPLVEGDELRFSVVASDESGLRTRELVVVDAANKSHTLWVAGEGSVLTTTIDAGWGIGTARIGEVRLTDTKRNEAHYGANGNLRTVPAGATTHEVDLTSQVFQVEGRPFVDVTDAPPATTSSNAADFVFSTTDRDTAAADLSATCTLDGVERPCSPSGTSFAALSTGTHSLGVTVADPQGHRGATAYSWVVEPGAPATDTAAPTATITAPTKPFTFLPSPTLSWSGQDAGSGVASYDVRLTTATVTQGFTGWTRPAAWQGLTTTSRAASLPYGGTVCFAVRAHDRAGNVGAWSAHRCVTRHVDERTAFQRGTWDYVYSPALLGYDGLRSTQQGAALSSRLTTVRRVGVVASTCPTCGTVGVYVGGALVGKISLVSSQLAHRRLLVLPAFSARSGAVSVRVLTTGRPVLLDGLLLSRV